MKFKSHAQRKGFFARLFAKNREPEYVATVKNVDSRTGKPTNWQGVTHYKTSVPKVFKVGDTINEDHGVKSVITSINRKKE